MKKVFMLVAATVVGLMAYAPPAVNTQTKQVQAKQVKKVDYQKSYVCVPAYIEYDSGVQVKIPRKVMEENILSFTYVHAYDKTYLKDKQNVYEYVFSKEGNDFFYSSKEKLLVGMKANMPDVFGKGIKRVVGRTLDSKANVVFACKEVKK